MARWVLFRFHMRNLANYIWDDFIGSSEHSYSWNEKDNSIDLELDIPGFSKEEIDVKSKANVISISGKPKEGNKRREFKLSFKVPSSVNADATKAELNNGVLELSVPKKAEELSKDIFIKIT